MQYFSPALRDNWSLKPIFCLFESGCFIQALLYFIFQIPKLTKHKAPPETLYREPSEFKKIDVVRQTNRRKAEVGLF